MRRYGQVVIWIFCAPLLGAIQGLTSFSLLMLRYGNLNNPDLHRLFVGLALVYGGGWFAPALIISDLLLLRRTLSQRDFVQYVVLIAVIALGVGFVTPGMLIMVGYPITALAILGCGFLYRRKAETRTG